MELPSVSATVIDKSKAACVIFLSRISDMLENQAGWLEIGTACENYARGCNKGRPSVAIHEGHMRNCGFTWFHVSHLTVNKWWNTENPWYSNSWTKAELNKLGHRMNRVKCLKTNWEDLAGHYFSTPNPLLTGSLGGWDKVAIVKWATQRLRQKREASCHRKLGSYSPSYMVANAMPRKVQKQ